MLRYVTEPIDRNLHLLKILPDLRQPNIGCATCPEIMLKATSSPTDISPSITAFAPNSSSNAVVTLAHILDRPLAARADQSRVEGGGDVGCELFLPLHLHGGFDRGGLDGLRADDRFDQHLLALGAAIELLLDRLAQDGPNQGGDIGDKGGSRATTISVSFHE